ncbi:MAG: hypothetical protein ACRD1G_00235, partial [Acidimicrobiales bacterium]
MSSHPSTRQTPASDHREPPEHSRKRRSPTAGRLKFQEILYVVPTEGDDIFVMYEYELKEVR